ncbi:hypothetical protein THOM_1251 [Trachipleistophora hominis]|uniref:Uncharacterized protein n=1 Tax=Trachipleistophora hominis TaxID=72359 RepID=L7JWW3_TRAHO|nr:hypothetical protein THOM_1251 [Trachipleistophora hominis]
MSGVIDYFYYDYILYHNIKRFINGEKPKFDIVQLLASDLKGIEEQLTLKLKLNKIISILQTNECKNMMVCCRFDLISKLGRCILIQCANEELQNVLLQTYLVIGKNKNAFASDKVYNMHVRSFKNKIRRIHKGIAKKSGDKSGSKVLFRVGSEQFNILFTALMVKEFKKFLKR